MQHTLTVRREAKPAGVVDTLTAGFAVLNRRLWVLAIPILLDLFLWLGPQVSFSPLIGPAITGLGEWVLQAAEASPRAAAQGTTLVTDLTELRGPLIETVDSINALGLAAHGPLSVPAAALVVSGIGSLVFVDTWGSGLLILAGALLVGLVLGGLLRSLLAQQVRAPGSNPLVAGVQTPRQIARVLGLVLAVLGVGLLLGVPVLLLVGLATAVMPDLAAVSLLLLGVALLFVEFYLFFAVDAIFVSNVGPLAAVQRSVAVVRRWFWPTLGFIAVTWLILAGMDQVWVALATTLQSPFGPLLGILGNAYIATGLIAASMIFYYERVKQVPANSGTPLERQTTDDTAR